MIILCEVKKSLSFWWNTKFSEKFAIFEIISLKLLEFKCINAYQFFQNFQFFFGTIKILWKISSVFPRPKTQWLKLTSGSMKTSTGEKVKKILQFAWIFWLLKKTNACIRNLSAWMHAQLLILLINIWDRFDGITSPKWANPKITFRLSLRIRKLFTRGQCRATIFHSSESASPDRGSDGTRTNFENHGLIRTGLDPFPWDFYVRASILSSRLHLKF